MRKILFGFSLILVIIMSVACQDKARKSIAEEIDTDTIIVDADQYVRFETTGGNFVIKLYRETPLHRHNMVKQVKKGNYDGQLFFGVERNYKIQAGDIKSKGAPVGAKLGAEEEYDTIDSEIKPTMFYHKRGAVGQASVRQFDFSTSQQFYIIIGTRCNTSALDVQEKKINKRYFKAVKDSLTQPYSKQILEYRDKKYSNKISVLNDKLTKETESIMKTRPEFKYSQEQIDQYTKVGGTALLDGFYTVFGEVIDGIEIVETISKSHIDKNHRPVPDVKIIKATLIDYPEKPVEPAQ